MNLNKFNVTYKFRGSPSLTKGLSAPNLVKDKSKQQYTFHETSKNATYYPGTLNKDSQNNIIISEPSSEEQVKASMQKTAKDHGGVIASEYSPLFTNSRITMYRAIPFD